MHFWSHSGKAGVPIEYDGVPFVHVGRWSLICHQGKDIGARAKAKYIEKKKRLEQEGAMFSSRKTTTKKVNCPALIYVSHIVKYSQFKVPAKFLSENSLPTEQLRRTMKEKMRAKHRSHPSNVMRVHCYFVRLPEPGDHQGHPFVAQVLAANAASASVVVSNTSTLDRRKVNRNRDRQRRTREPMDERVAVRLEELIRSGHCSTAGIRAELNKFVIQHLFEGEPAPPAMFRRYNPTSRDILNAMHRVKQEALVSRCAELRSHCSIALNSISGALSTIEDEVALTNLYKQLIIISKQFESEEIKDTKLDCSVIVHQLPPEESSSYHVVTVIEEPAEKKIKLENVDCNDTCRNVFQRDNLIYGTYAS